MHQQGGVDVRVLKQVFSDNCKSRTIEIFTPEFRNKMKNAARLKSAWKIKPKKKGSRYTP